MFRSVLPTPILRRGFTLIELMVVIGIIGILASTTVAALDQAKEKALIARSTAEMKNISTAFQAYVTRFREFPPIGDACSGCLNPCDATNWNPIVVALQSSGIMRSAPATDPWGQAYCYDDNFYVPNCNYSSVLWSSGPNGVNESAAAAWSPTPTFLGDDFGIILAGPTC